MASEREETVVIAEVTVPVTTLDPEAKRILYESLWELYDTDEVRDPSPARFDLREP